MQILYAGAIGQKDTATSIHVLRNARLLEKMGHTVFFCCEYPIQGEAIHGEEFKIDYSKPYYGSRKVRSIQWILEQIVGFRMWQKVKKNLLEIHPDVLIYYDPASIILYWRVLKLCKRLHIAFAVEVTEWAESKDYTGIVKLVYWQRDIRKKYLDIKCGNMIAISPFLERHYTNQGANVLRLPPIYQDNDFRTEPVQINRKTVQLVFAGTLAQKDFLSPMIKAVNEINSKSIKIEFIIIGVDKQSFKDHNSVELEKGIRFLGRIDHEKVLQYVAKAHMSVLLREDKRYAKAGVSTKFTEAMCVGTPSICTKVGGTDVYVKDGINGFLVVNNDIKTLIEVLNRILQMSEDQMMKMKKEALKTANEYFYDENYRDAFATFLNKMIKRDQPDDNDRLIQNQ